MEEMTTQTQENEQEITQETQETQETTQPVESSNSEPVIIESLPDNSENIIHELFAELGVNLDYTPQNNYQCFTMALQFAAAIWFISWFVKYLWGVLRSFLSPRGWC